MEIRSRLTTGVLALGLGLGLAGVATGAQAAPTFDPSETVTLGCQDGEGGFTFFEVGPLGSIGFVVDEEGRATGEKVFLVSIDFAAFADSGELVFEFHKSYGKRTGHGEPLSCSGTEEVEPGVTAFFDALVTRR